MPFRTVWVADRGFDLVSKVENREVSDEDTHAYIAVRRRISDAFETHVRLHVVTVERS